MNNEENILAMLVEIKATQEKQGQTLEEHSKMFEKMQDDITAIKIYLDYDVDKRFDAVKEGIDAILAQLTPRRKVEEMDADIVVLKTAVKMLTQEVAELEKAQ